MKIRKLLALSALALAAVAPLAAPAQQAVRVGSKNFTDQFVLAEIYAQALEAAGIKTEKKLNLGGTLIAQKAMEEKQIDFYPEYTGTMLLAVLKQEPMTDAKAVYDKVKEGYAKMGFVVLNRVSALLDETTMAQMNYQVDGDKLEPKDVARDFLKAKGLVK